MQREVYRINLLPWVLISFFDSVATFPIETTYDKNTKVVIFDQETSDQILWGLLHVLSAKFFDND